MVKDIPEVGTIRKILLVANWKMNKTQGEAQAFCEEFLPLVKEVDKIDIAICPPFTSLYILKQMLSDSLVKLGAQNMYAAEKGAYTGEISPLMLKDAGCTYVIIGHSERRQVLGESDEEINGKMLLALEAGLIPILCVGETLDERESNRAEEVVARQLEASLQGVKPEALVIAYEPVWAIGSGKNASTDDAGMMCSFIRTNIEKLLGAEAAAASQILYGGSVNESNLKDFLQVTDIDGALVGGASLAADSWLKLVRIGENV